MLLELKDITKSFSGVDGDVEVLRGVSLGLDAGETLALIGESGSGKSTILHISAGLEVPDGGSIHLEGVEINELSEAESQLRVALHIDPNYASAHTNLGRVLEAANRLDEAKEAFITAAKLRAYPDPLLGLARLGLKQGQHEQALKWADAAYRLEATKDTLLLLGEIHHHLGNVQQALDCFEGANAKA